jgi:hypothetical protein
MGRKKKETNNEEVVKQFILSNDEFQPLLKQIYLSNLDNVSKGKDHFPINVDPEKITCLRLTKGGGKKYAYIKPIRKEYALLTQCKYFMVICNDTFDKLSIERQKYVILHEYCHAWFDQEKQTYETIDHDIKDFSFLLKNSEWNTGLVEEFRYEPNIKFGDTPEEKIAVKE